MSQRKSSSPKPAGTESSSGPPSTTVSVREAVQRAYAFFRQFYEGHDFDAIRVEEVELLEGKGRWAVTLGFDDKETRRDNPLSILPPRRYKVIEIDSLSGEFRAMKMRASQQ